MIRVKLSESSQNYSLLFYSGLEGHLHVHLQKQKKETHVRGRSQDALQPVCITVKIMLTNNVIFVFL